MKEQSEQDFIVEKFSYESLEKLSKAELIDIVYRLQDALVDLRVTVCGYAQIGMHKPLYKLKFSEDIYCPCVAVQYTCRYMIAASINVHWRNSNERAE